MRKYVCIKTNPDGSKKAEFIQDGERIHFTEDELLNQIETRQNFKQSVSEETIALTDIREL